MHKLMNIMFVFADCCFVHILTCCDLGVCDVSQEPACDGIVFEKQEDAIDCFRC